MITLTAADFQGRPAGVSSRVRKVQPTSSHWVAGNKSEVPLPLIVDIAELAEDAITVDWWVAALIELREGMPRVTEMHLEAKDTGLDLDHLQREFRWRSPLEVVLRIVPQMIAAGADPFRVSLPTEGFPLVTLEGRHDGRRLSDDFLQDVVRQYLVIGRGYTNQLAAEYQVSPRTVKSWVQKARARGLLTETEVGRVGGDLVE